METLLITSEKDFRKWVKEAMKECVEEGIITLPVKTNTEKPEGLLSRKEISSYLGISLVTLTDWMKRGLPFHKVNGRVYFQQTEVLEYVKNHRKKS